MFVRVKRYATSGKWRDSGVRYSLVDNQRTAGPVRQRVVFDLGRYPTVEAALGALPVEAAEARSQAEDCRRRIAQLLEQERQTLRQQEERQAQHDGRDPDPRRWAVSELPKPRRAAMNKSSQFRCRCYWTLRKLVPLYEGRAAKQEADLARLRQLVAESGLKIDEVAVAQGGHAALAEMAEQKARTGHIFAGLFGTQES